MNLPIQDEILKKYSMLGIDSSLLSEGIQPGLTVPDWVNEGPLYEGFIRNFTRDGSFAATEKKLPYLKDLGVKTIWLMPSHPIGKEKRKGKLGSPYAISDHKEINPDYGTKKQFRHLIDAIHDYDMHIIIDMVLNHGASDHVHIVRNIPKCSTRLRNVALRNGLTLLNLIMEASRQINMAARFCATGSKNLKLMDIAVMSPVWFH